VRPKEVRVFPAPVQVATASKLIASLKITIIHTFRFGLVSMKANVAMTSHSFHDE
jgi:hypothetical protein